MKGTRDEPRQDRTRTPWFWAIVGIAVLLLINSIKNPAYLALSVNPTTGC